MIHTPFDALLAALDIAGSQKALADYLNITSPAVSDWYTSKKPIPRKHVKSMNKYIQINETIDRPLPPDLLLTISTVVKEAEKRGVPINFSISVGNSDEFTSAVLTH